MLDYEEIDKETTFYYGELWLKTANELGFEYISEALVEMYKEGLSTREIGRKMEIHRSSVMRFFRLWGVEMRSRGGAHGGRLGKHKEEVDEKPDVYFMTTTEIAEKLGLSATRVQQILDQALRNFKENWAVLYGAYSFEQLDSEMFSGMLRREREKEK